MLASCKEDGKWSTKPPGFGEENGEAEVKQQAREHIMIIVRPESLYLTLDLKFYLRQ